MKPYRRIAAALVLAAQAGCGSAELFRSHDLPESPEVGAAPWPRLADTPPAPAVGSPAVPDPAVGAAVAAELREAARAAAARAVAIGQPVLSDAERARLARLR